MDDALRVILTAILRPATVPNSTMSSLVVFPSTTNAFSSYRPSVRAHVDFIKPGSGSQHSTGRIVKLELPCEFPSRSRMSLR